MSQPKRTYDSSLRRERAAQTRRRVLDAAADVFTEQGYTGSTVAAIAARAGVSADTVRTTGPKSTLLLEAFRLRYGGGAGWRSILEQDAARRVLEIDDPEEGLAAAADFLQEAHRRSARLWTVVRAAALTDAQVAEGLADLVGSKSESFATTADWLVRIGAVPGARGADATLAAEVNLVMSAEAYLLLTEDYGLDDGDYRAWVVDALGRCGS